MNTQSSRMAGVAVGLALLLSSCITGVQSVQPVVPASEAHFDPHLLGTWVSRRDEHMHYYVVSRAADGSNAYTIEVVREESDVLELMAGLGWIERHPAMDLILMETARDPVDFDARLGRLGERIVFELSKPRSEEHYLLVLEVGDDEIHVSALDTVRLAEALEAGQLSLAYKLDRSSTDLLLEDSTDNLREQLADYLQRPRVLTEGTIYRRVKDASLAGSRLPVHAACFEASPWHEADQRFHRDSQWRGADVGASVDLGAGRILWLFGHTVINIADRGEGGGDGDGDGTQVIANSIALQVGTNPATSQVKFYWGNAEDGAPAALFPGGKHEQLRFSSGVRIDDRLVLFFTRVRTGDIFDRIVNHYKGWSAIMVENPDDEPPDWRVRPLDVPGNPLGVLLGSAGVLRLDGYVYAFGSQHRITSHPIFVARWPEETMREGDLGEPQWWAGDQLGWVPESSSAARWPLFQDARPEMTVHLDPVSQQFLAVHTVGLMPADLAMRAAPRLVGPWSSPRMIHRPSEYYRPFVMIDGARVHPQLTGADLVLTYTTQHWSEERSQEDGGNIYSPRFVRLVRCQ
jgi:hypothetical protein